MNTNQNNSANNTNLNNSNVNNSNVNNNLQDDTIVKMAHTNTRDIPVDVNSEVELHKRWNCSHSTAPDPVPNGGLFGGPQAMGPYANIHVIPTATNMIHYNLRSANPPPGATTQYPGTNRSKNNYMPTPGVYWFNDTHPVNKGPYAIKVTRN